MSGLFRNEVLEARRDQYLGTVRIGQSLNSSLTMCFAISCGLMLVVFCIFGHITRKARITGVLIPELGSIPISLGGTGVLLKQQIHEGETVRLGQPLFVFGTDHATSSGEMATLISQSIDSRSASLHAEQLTRQMEATQREQALSNQQRSIESQERQAEDEIELAKRRVELASATLGRYEQLAKDGFVAQQQVQQKQEELIDLQGRWRTTERNHDALQRDKIAIDTERATTATQLKTEVAQLNRARAELDQQRAENDPRHEMVITSPGSGVITTVNIHIGESAQAAQTLATLLPTDAAGTLSSLRAQLFAPSRTTGFVESGQRVWLRYSAYPYQKFGMQGGRVVSISRTPINPQDLPSGLGNALLAAAQTNEPLYRIDVKLDDQAIYAYGVKQSLRPGMLLEADVVQDRRAIWEWILDPIFSGSKEKNNSIAMPASVS